jgi:hypothetical protein
MEASIGGSPQIRGHSYRLLPVQAMLRDCGVCDVVSISGVQGCGPLVDAKLHCGFVIADYGLAEKDKDVAA